MGVSISRVEDNRIVDANEGFLELTGYSRDELIGRTPIELGLMVDPADRANDLRNAPPAGTGA